MPEDLETPSISLKELEKNIDFIKHMCYNMNSFEGG